MCEQCVEVTDPSTSMAIVSLGSGARVKISPCPFCQLVTRAYLKDSIDVADDPDVTLVWTIKGPTQRNAWNVIGAGSDTCIGFGRTAAHVTSETDLQVGDISKSRETFFIEPKTSSLLDTGRMVDWLTSCERTHSTVCEIPTPPRFTDAFRGLHILRLIDVEARCLVERRVVEKYVALSYVWGAISNFRLTKSNKYALLERGSLKRVWHLLPWTIKDTIDLVQRLGIRYLWVDALCLLQNDAEDLDLGVNVMDLIYERAWCTVVAGCGYVSSQPHFSLCKNVGMSFKDLIISGDIRRSGVNALHINIKHSPPPTTC